MNFANCQQCSKPFAQKGNILICSACLDQENKMYTFYYQKLSRLVNHINYGLVARKTGLNRERLEQTLGFRLSVGGIADLPLWKRGTCNVCNNRLRNTESSEPLCVNCLDQILQWIERDPQVLKRDGQSKMISPSQAELQTNKPPKEQETGIQDLHAQTIPSEHSIRTGSLPLHKENSISQAAYDAIINQLELYREYFGELPEEAMTSKEMADHLREVSATPFEANEVLIILDQENEHIVLNEDEMQCLETAHLYIKDGRIRHFGFKRSDAQKRVLA